MFLRMGEIIARNMLSWLNCVPPHPGQQEAASSVLYTTSCKHSLVFLRMGEIIARNMLSWLNSVPPHPGHQEAASSVLYTTSCKHRLVFLRMGEIIARNMLSWLKLLIKLLLMYLFGCLYCYSYTTVSNKRMDSLHGIFFSLEVRFNFIENTEATE